MGWKGGERREIDEGVTRHPDIIGGRELSVERYSQELEALLSTLRLNGESCMLTFDPLGLGELLDDLLWQ